MEEHDCKPGHWYWAEPMYDVDDDRPYDDQTKPVPAQYQGNGKWLWPDVEGDHWPSNGRIHHEVAPLDPERINQIQCTWCETRHDIGSPGGLRVARDGQCGCK